MAFLLLLLIAAPLFGIVYFLTKRHLTLLKYIKGSRLPYVMADSYIRGSFDRIVTSDISIGENLHKLFDIYGETWFGFGGVVPFVFTKDLDLIYHVWVLNSHKHINRPYVSTPTEHSDTSLLQARDDNWRRTRRAIGSTMTPSKLNAANVERDVNDCLDKLMANLEKKSKRLYTDEKCQFDVDCTKVFKNFVMDTFLSIAFDQPNQIDYNLDENDLVTNAEDACKKSNSPIIQLTFFIRELTPLVRMIVKLFRLNGFIRCLCDMLNSIIDKMSNSGNKTLTGDKRKMIHSLLELYKDKKINREELMSNTYFLLLAGWDTTSDSLAALMWHLAKYPEIQEKLRSDIIREGIDSNYLLWTIKESLRMHPPASTAREIGEDIEWKGYTLMKGMALVMFSFTLMKDKGIWGDDVDIFRPERFDEATAQKVHPAQYLVFGLGQRNCVGYHLAMLELKLTTCRLLMNYRIECCSETPDSLKLKEGQGTLFYVNMLRDSVPLRFVPLHL